MKSHDFARQLNLMAKILKSGPNVELKEIELSTFMTNSRSYEIKSRDIPKALSLLVGLNEVDKSQWLALIDEYQLDIDIRARDAKRDIIGKLLNYLSIDTEAREKLAGKRIPKAKGTSSELADALSILLS